MDMLRQSLGCLEIFRTIISYYKIVSLYDFFFVKFILFRAVDQVLLMMLASMVACIAVEAILILFVSIAVTLQLLLYAQHINLYVMFRFVHRHETIKLFLVNTDDLMRENLYLMDLCLGIFFVILT